MTSALIAVVAATRPSSAPESVGGKATQRGKFVAVGAGDPTGAGAAADAFAHRLNPTGLAEQRLGHHLVERRRTGRGGRLTENRGILLAGTTGLRSEVAEHLGHREEARPRALPDVASGMPTDLTLDWGVLLNADMSYTSAVVAAGPS